MTKVKQSENLEVLDINDVAVLLRVKDRTIRNWLKDKDMPSTKDERGRRFDWALVLPWYVKMMAEESGNERKRVPEVALKPQAEADAEEPVVPDETYKEALTRKTSAEADLKEIERAQKRREVVAAADAKMVLDRLFTNIKQKLLGVPSKLSSRLDGIKDRNQRKAILESEMRQICQELSQADAVTGRIPGDADAAN